MLLNLLAYYIIEFVAIERVLTQMPFICKSNEFYCNIHLKKCFRIY